MAIKDNRFPFCPYCNSEQETCKIRFRLSPASSDQWCCDKCFPKIKNNFDEKYLVIYSNQIGRKFDNGKAPVRQGLLEYFPRACKAVAEVSAFGASKYEWGNWNFVDDAINRYSNAGARHICDAAIQGETDNESGLLHAAHEAWNALAVLEKKLLEIEENIRLSSGTIKDKSENPWIKWKGGKCPVSEGVYVEFKVRSHNKNDSTISKGTTLEWQHDKDSDDPFDIVSYRIVKL